MSNKEHDLDVILLELGELAAELPDNSRVRKAIAEKKPLETIWRTAHSERNDESVMPILHYEAAKTYDRIAGAARYADNMLDGNDAIIIGNYTEVMQIEDDHARHTLGQRNEFTEAIEKAGLPGTLVPFPFNAVYLWTPEEAEAAERIAAGIYDHAVLRMERRFMVLAPEWEDGPTNNMLHGRIVGCGICGKQYDRPIFYNGPLGCAREHEEQRRQQEQQGSDS